MEHFIHSIHAVDRQFFQAAFHNTIPSFWTFLLKGKISPHFDIFS